MFYMTCSEHADKQELNTLESCVLAQPFKIKPLPAQVIGSDVKMQFVLYLNMSFSALIASGDGPRGLSAFMADLREAMALVFQVCTRTCHSDFFFIPNYLLFRV